MSTCSKYSQLQLLPGCTFLFILLTYYHLISLNETQLSYLKSPFSICQQFIVSCCRYYASCLSLSELRHIYSLPQYPPCPMSPSYGFSHWLRMFFISSLVKCFSIEKIRSPFSTRHLPIHSHYVPHRIIALKCCPNAYL